MRQQSDADQINRTCDLVALAGCETRLRQSGAYHSGACPFCGGRDRFVVKRTPDGDRWYCRKCGDCTYHTPIDYVMRRDRTDFRTALRLLEQTSVKHLPLPPHGSFHGPAPSLPDDKWQAAALREIDAAAERLFSELGEAGRDYLLHRGLHHGTWRAWQLGFELVYDPSCRVQRPAVVLPWLDMELGNENVVAIKYRFIDDAVGGLRYLNRKGSVPLLFGLWSVVPQHHTLILIEGEINALSIWQCMPEGVTVGSFGSEAGANSLALKALVRPYAQVFVWADDPERASEIRSSLGCRAKAVQSPLVAGTKWDANAMLQRGLLMDFLQGLLGVRCLGWDLGARLSSTARR